MRRHDLSSDRRRLLDIMRGMGYGRIENLTIRTGEPVIDKSLRLVHEKLLGKKVKGRTLPPRADFELKAQQIELFECFDQMQDGLVPILKVQGGLPFQLHMEERVTA